MTARQVPLAAGQPLIGSMLDLRHDSLGTFLKARDEHGDIVRFTDGPPGLRRDFHAVFSADGAREVLDVQAENFRKDSKRHDELRASLGSGLLTSQDETYARQHRLVSPLFTTERVDAYATAMVDEVERWRGGWDGEIDVFDASTRLAVRVVARALFGADADGVIDTVRRCFPIIGTHAMKRGFEPISLPRWFPTPGNRRASAAQRELRAACDRIVEARRAGGAPAGGAPDLVGLLASAEDEAGDSMAVDEVRDHVLVFFFAARNNTSLSLGFALHLLGRHPEAQARAHAEVSEVLGGRAPTAADLVSLPYLTTVMKETMRLYPPVPMIARHAVAETVVDGYRIPAGADVLVSPWVIHRHPAYWSDPSLFRPERFSTGALRNEGSWLPFGSGPRTCIGQRFSMLESVLALAILLQAYEFEAVGGDVPLTLGITLQTAGPARCKVTARA